MSEEARMDYKCVTAQEYADEYKNLVVGLCRVSGEWRPGALGYLLSQIREHHGPVVDMDQNACIELRCLLDAACRAARSYPRDKRILTIKEVAVRILKEASVAHTNAVGAKAGDPEALRVVHLVLGSAGDLALQLRVRG